MMKNHHGSWLWGVKPLKPFIRWREICRFLKALQLEWCNNSGLCQGDVAKKIFDWCLGLWMFALVLGFVLRFKEVAIRNNKLLCNVGFWTPTSIRSEAATQIIMIQHCNMIQHDPTSFRLHLFFNWKVRSMAFFTHHESPWERFYQGAYWILKWFNFWRVKQKWFLPKQRRNRFQVTAIWNRIGALLPTYMHLAWSRMYMLWSYWSWWHGTSNYTNTKTSPGSWNYNKKSHPWIQTMFVSFSWELQTSLSHWSMIYFLCVFCSAYPNSGKWVGETSGIFVVHVILVVAIVSWDPNSTVDLWMRFFERDTEMDSIYHFTCSIFERT